MKLRQMFLTTKPVTKETHFEAGRPMRILEK